MDAEVTDILSGIKAGRIEPVYLLQGEEVFYIDLISNYIEATVLSEGEKSFNQVILYGRDTPVQILLTHARRFPMMAERQVVIVREAQDMPDLSKESGQKLLLDYFTRPVPSTLLVLCHKHKSLDKRKELGKKADKLVHVATFKKLYDNQLPDFVKEHAKRIGCAIDEQGIQVLCDYVGNDLSRLANELDKLNVGGTQTGPITADQVMAQVGISREYNIFELQKALIQLDLYKSVRIADYFAGNTKKNPLIVVVAFLFGFFSKLLLAATTPGISEREMPSVLKISPFASRDYSAALRNFSIPKITENLKLLKEADLRLKGVNAGGGDEGQMIRELVVRLIR